MQSPHAHSTRSGGSLIKAATSLNLQSVLLQKIHGDRTTITSCEYLAERVYEVPRSSVAVKVIYENYRNWFATTGLRGQLGRKQFANRVEAAGVTKSSRRSQGYFFENVSLR